MKKFFLIILSALFLAGCASETKTTRVQVKGIEEVSYDKLMSLMKEDKQFILYIGRPDCGDCQQFEPLLKDYLNKHKNEGVYYINTKTYRAKAKQENASANSINILMKSIMKSRIVLNKFRSEKNLSKSSETL